MTLRTPEAAAEALCPFARTFSAPKAQPGCQGPACMLWRWMPLSSDLLTPHVQKRLAEQGDKKHAEAVAWVMKNREELGIPTRPTHGYCGAGGATHG